MNTATKEPQGTAGIWPGSRKRTATASADPVRHYRLALARKVDIIVVTGASLNANQAWWQLLKESQHRPPLQLTTDDHLAASVNAVNLAN